MSFRTKIETGIRNPSLLGRKLNQFYHSRGGRRAYNPNGTDIFDESWDNIIILDACREDLFRQVFSSPDFASDFQIKESRGSNTVEYLHGNFAERDLTDTVYITANPQYHRHRSELNTQFHSVHNIWEESWNSNHDSVLPSEMTERTINIAEKYPHKRIISHYIQPHYPFINWENDLDKGHLSDENPDKNHIWLQIMSGELSEEGINNVVEEYKKNLEILVPYMEEIATKLIGKTIITSDHGNALGENSFPIPIAEWGHPRHIHIPELLNVPWLEIEGERRNITKEKPKENQSQDMSEEVESRLEKLGYK